MKLFVQVINRKKFPEENYIYTIICICRHVQLVHDDYQIQMDNIIINCSQTNYDKYKFFSQNAYIYMINCMQLFKIKSMMSVRMIYCKNHFDENLRTLMQGIYI